MTNPTDNPEFESVTTDVLSGADIASASEGEVPASNGAGNLVMEAVSGGFDIITSTEPGLSFGTWRQASSSNDAIAIVGVYVVTDGSNIGRADIKVDESGGTSADYTYYVRADTDGGSGFSNEATFTLPLPAGAQYRVVNASDPTGGNIFRPVREFVSN
jgi:hypothetical protein